MSPESNQKVRTHRWADRFLKLAKKSPLLATAALRNVKDVDIALVVCERGIARDPEYRVLYASILERGIELAAREMNKGGISEWILGEQRSEQKVYGARIASDRYRSLLVQLANGLSAS